MKILLIYPPYNLDAYGKLGPVANLSQPLGIAYLGAVLEQEGWEVKIIDAPPLGWSLEEVIDSYKRFGPDIVGLTSLTVDFGKAIKIAQRVKEENPQQTIVLGGPHVTASPDKALLAGPFDYGVIGEGEATFLELVKSFAAGTLEDIRGNILGLAFRNGQEVIKNPPRPYLENLDELPFPARHLMPPLDLYHPTPASYKKLPVGTIMTSRGCPFQCIYCDRSIFGNACRFRSPKNVVDELEILLGDFGAREVRFWDDTFNADSDRVIAICDEIVRRKLDFPWTCLGRVNFINRPLLQAMQRAGCWQISFGIESGNPEVLKRVKKGLTLEMAREAISLVKKEGLGARGYFMLGLPGETEETMQQTIDFAKSLPLDVVGFYPVVPFPGTELYEYARAAGELYNGGIGFEDYVMVLPEHVGYIPKGLTEEKIKEYVLKAHREFYLRPSYLWQQLLAIKGPRDVYNKVRAFLTIRKL